MGKSAYPALTDEIDEKLVGKVDPPLTDGEIGVVQSDLQLRNFDQIWGGQLSPLGKWQGGFASRAVIPL